MRSGHKCCVPRQQGWCLLVRAVLFPARGPTEGRQKNTRQKDKKKGREKELKQNEQFYVQLADQQQDDAKRPNKKRKQGRDKELPGKRKRTYDIERRAWAVNSP